MLHVQEGYRVMYSGKVVVRITHDPNYHRIISLDNSQRVSGQVEGTGPSSIQCTGVAPQDTVLLHHLPVSSRAI